MSTYSDGFTDRRRTRVYQRPADTTVVTRRDDFIGQTMAIEPKKKLFEGVSFAQVVAGAAAAATSVALASYIGIAGSIIGAAISSVVTVVSSQLYRRALDASARKIKIASAKAKTTMFAEQPDAPGMTANGGRGARIAPSELRERAATERRTTQRKVIAFSVIAAAVAVAACAGAILLGTAGEGIGEKTQAIPTPAISQTERQPVEQDEAPALTTQTTLPLTPLPARTTTPQLLISPALLHQTRMLLRTRIPMTPREMPLTSIRLRLMSPVRGLPAARILMLAPLQKVPPTAPPPTPREKRTQTAAHRAPMWARTPSCSSHFTAWAPCRVPTFDDARQLFEFWSCVSAIQHPSYR